MSLFILNANNPFHVFILVQSWSLHTMLLLFIKKHREILNLVNPRPSFMAFELTERLKLVTIIPASSWLWLLWPCLQVNFLEIVGCYWCYVFTSLGWCDNRRQHAECQPSNTLIVVAIGCCAQVIVTEGLGSLGHKWSSHSIWDGSVNEKIDVASEMLF